VQRIDSIVFLRRSEALQSGELETVKSTAQSE